PVASKSMLAAERSKRAITGFDPFNSGASRSFVMATGRGGFELLAGYEMMPSFGASFVEILQAPKSEAERQLTVSALRALSDHLVEQGAVSTFNIAPADDPALASCFLAAGFRRSGLLLSHLVVRGARRDAFVWSKK